MNDRGPAWLTVETCFDLQTAQVLASRLDAAGIETLIPDQSMAGLVWHMSQTIGGVRVQVRSEDFEDARVLLTAGVSDGDGEEDADEARTGGAHRFADRRSAADELAHRAFKVAVIATLFVPVVPYAVSLMVSAGKSPAPLSSWGRNRLTMAAILVAFSTVVVFALVRMGLDLAAGSPVFGR